MDVWAQVLTTVQKRVNQESYDTWFRPIVFEGCDGTLLRLSVPNETFRKWLLANYSEILQNAVDEAVHSRLQILVRAGSVAGQERTTAPADPPERDERCQGTLCSANTFETFVVGSSNQFAQAAARAVAERPSKAYNPLYIYGGTGLGKTHLMHSIGHYIRQRNGRLRFLYMSSDTFLNDLITSIRHETTFQFRQKYRDIDVLMMDDIQFLAGKERTQQEFFHTFNALYDAQKQIVITSDCPPKDIPTIEERLNSRFAWGLIADIQPPDLETRLAILKRRAASDNAVIPDAVAMYLVSSIRSNIRDLNGALTRLLAKASLDGIDAEEIDLCYAKEVLKDIVKGGKETVSSEMVIRAVSVYFGLKPDQLKSKNNSRPVVQPRQIGMFVCKKLTGLSLPQIGKAFGGKHHTTVLHSIHRIAELQKTDPEIHTAIDRIISSFR